jgi:hypothetical protein
MLDDAMSTMNAMSQPGKGADLTRRRVVDYCRPRAAL